MKPLNFCTRVSLHTGSMVLFAEPLTPRRADLAESQQAVGIPRPSRIRAARELRGYTQVETVQRMATPVSAAALSQLESGKARPTMRTLEGLAAVLEVPLEFFFAEWDVAGTDDVLSHVPYFRDLAATPARERRRAGALALLLSVLLAAVETRVRLPSLAIPDFATAADATREEIEEVAQAVRGEWDLADNPIGSVTEQIEQHGVPVARLSLGEHRVDAFSVRFDRRPLILLTDDKSNYVRSRFDAAHELGHLIMHRRGDPSDRAIERQAHNFAASFLMPADVARDILPRRIDAAAWTIFAALKRDWGVSIAALLFRTRDLGLISADSYRNAMKYMSMRGWRKSEPGDRQMGAPEPPRMIERALRLIKVQYSETLEDLARMTHLPVEDISHLVATSVDQRPRLT